MLQQKIGHLDLVWQGEKIDDPAKKKPATGEDIQESHERAPQIKFVQP
jgi:hypothetical protein